MLNPDLTDRSRGKHGAFTRFSIIILLYLDYVAGIFVYMRVCFTGIIEAFLCLVQ